MLKGMVHCANRNRDVKVELYSSHKMHNAATIWDRFREKGPSAYYKICYKNALRLNRYNFRTVNAIDFLFSTLHSTPFLYVDLYFRVLHKLRADAMRPDYPWGSKLPHLQVGASNSFQIQCVCRGVLSLLICSVR